MDIESLLSPLIKDIMQDKFSTKQKAFQQHISSIEKSIDMFGWNKTTEHLNRQMNKNLSVNTYKTMVYRSKKKPAANSKEKTVISNITKNPLNALSKPKSTDYNPTPDKSRIYGDDE
ncbi:hypothetical protein L3T44_004226 [Escherichia coli]|nr:hypothetical protein [Escherichia coli]